jgi:hypothetical protein
MAAKVAAFEWIEATRTALTLSDLSLRGYFAHIGRHFALLAFLIAPES